jgi:hypothetical protein
MSTDLTTESSIYLEIIMAFLFWGPNLSQVSDYRLLGAQSCRNLFPVCQTIGLADVDNVSDLSNICQTYINLFCRIFSLDFLTMTPSSSVRVEVKYTFCDFIVIDTRDNFESF